MATWEMVLVAAIAIGLVVWLAPGIKRSIANGPKGSSSDWLGVSFIIGLVVLFVLLLITLV